MESPLVNEYKKTFIYRRLLETFFGGLRVFLLDVPNYVYIIQVILFLLTPLICSTLILLIELDILSMIVGVWVACGCVAAVCCGMQIFAFTFRRRKSSINAVEQVNLAVDEEVFLFDSPLGPETWSFIIPAKRHKINILFHSLIAGCVAAAVVYYNRPNALLILGMSWGYGIAFCVFGVFTLSVGVWPLVVGSPPESAVFHPLPFDLPALSRASHILTCVLIHLLARYSELYWLWVVDCVGHFIFILCPFLWLFGVLPPIDAYILWVAEVLHVIGMGGSPSATDARLILQVLLGGLSLTMMAVVPSFTVLLALAALRGFILGIDSGWLLKMALQDKMKKTMWLSQQYNENIKPIVSHSSYGREIIFTAFLFIMVLALTLGIHLPQSDFYEFAFNNSILMSSNLTIGQVNRVLTPDIKPDFLKSQMINVVGGVLLLMTVVMLVVNCVQKVFIFSIVRNPLFRQYLQIRKSSMLYISTQMIQIGGPLISLLYIHMIIGAECYRQIIPNMRTLNYLFLLIPLARAYRYIWQFPHHSFIELTVYFIIDLIRMNSNGDFTDFVSYLAPTTRLFLISVIFLWSRKTCQKIITVVLFTYSSVVDFKQRKSINYFLLGFNVSAAPLMLSLIIISSVFSAPLLPLFTLPLFFIGFPRPIRFWSYPVGYSANHCSDSVYYKQLAPHVAVSVHNMVQSGNLGLVEPGDYFLLRWQDRFIWIQILECGFTYQYYSIKGLELQETSCHTAEASRVDAVLSQALDYNNDLKKSYSFYFNSYILHTLTPITKFTTVGYTDTKNVLTGVLDSVDTLQVVPEYFRKALLYLILRKVVNRLMVKLGNQKINKATRVLSQGKDVLMSLPKIEKVDKIIDNESDKVDMQEKESNRSNASRMSNHSGRTSRQAWVGGSQQDEVTTIDVQSRPNSWDDAEDPLGLEGDNYSRAMSSNENTVIGMERKLARKRSKASLPPINNKAQNYMKSEDPSDIPGIMYDSGDNSSLSNSEILRSDGGNYQRVTQIGSPTVNVRVISRTDNGEAKFNSVYSKKFCPPNHWMYDVPFEDDIIEDTQDRFPLSWFKFILSHFAQLYFKSAHISTEPNDQQEDDMIERDEDFDRDVLVQNLLQDDSLEESYRLLDASSYLIFFGVDAQIPTSSQVQKTFQGEIQWSTGIDWLKSKPTLYNLALQAYRISVKLSIDHVLIESSVSSDWPALFASVEEYSTSWFMGNDESSNEPSIIDTSNCYEPSTWTDAITMEMPNLFSIGHDAVKGVYTSHLVSLGPADIWLGRLDGETVRSFWSSLVAELLYLTNDDDERYSIQAHPILLRNLTIQAADPPLGYPIYSSPPIRHGPPWLMPPINESYKAK